MSIVIALALWALTIVKVISYRRGQDPTVLLCSLAFALSFSTDIDFIFQPLDVAWDGANYTNLAGHLLFSAGVYLLSRSIITAAQPLHARRFDIINRLALLAVLTIQAVSFFNIETSGSAGSFTTVYGDQLAAVIYAMAEIVYTSVVLGVTGLICLSYFSYFQSKRFRVGFLLTGIGCCLAIATEILGATFIVMRYRNDESGMSLVGTFQSPLYVLAILTLCAGLAVPSLMGKMQRNARHRQARQWAAAVEPVWAEATESRQEMLIQPGTESARLHRMLVETRDAILNNPAIPDSLDNGSLETLEDAENFLARSTPEPAPSR